jgi:hypothetical protein
MFSNFKPATHNFYQGYNEEEFMPHEVGGASSSGAPQKTFANDFLSWSIKTPGLNKAIGKSGDRKAARGIAKQAMNFQQSQGKGAYTELEGTTLIVYNKDGNGTPFSLEGSSESNGDEFFAERDGDEFQSSSNKTVSRAEPRVIQEKDRFAGMSEDQRMEEITKNPKKNDAYAFKFPPAGAGNRDGIPANRTRGFNDGKPPIEDISKQGSDRSNSSGNNAVGDNTTSTASKSGKSKANENKSVDQRTLQAEKNKPPSTWDLILNKKTKQTIE